VVTQDGRLEEDGSVGGQQHGQPGRIAAWVDINAGSNAGSNSSAGTALARGRQTQTTINARVICKSKRYMRRMTW